MHSWLPEGAIQTAFAGSPLPGLTGRFRDLSILNIGLDSALVIACDSNASIGSKPNDHFQWDPRMTGRSAVRVPLMEVLATGAMPVLVINNLCVELDPSGNAILEGIRDVCGLLSQPPAITGSDETNMPTTQTGVGVTVIGAVETSQCRLGRSVDGDRVVAVGMPVGGPDATAEERVNAVAGPETIQALLGLAQVHEILPVGSRGIAYEAGELAKGADLLLHILDEVPLDLERSAADCAVVLVSLQPGSVLTSDDVGGLPVTEIGTLTGW